MLQRLGIARKAVSGVLAQTTSICTNVASPPCVASMFAAPSAPSFCSRGSSNGGAASISASTLFAPFWDASNAAGGAGAGGAGSGISAIRSAGNGGAAGAGPIGGLGGTGGTGGRAGFCGGVIICRARSPAATPGVLRWFSEHGGKSTTGSAPASASRPGDDATTAPPSAADQLIIEEQERQRREYKRRKEREDSNTSIQMVQPEHNSETKYSGINQVFLHSPSAVERVLLVVALKYFPSEIPKRVERGVMNATWSRIRILGACLAWGYLLYWLEMSIRSGREARDGGDNCLYEDVSTSEIQAEKRRVTAGREASPVPLVAKLWKDTKRFVTGSDVF